MSYASICEFCGKARNHHTKPERAECSRRRTQIYDREPNAETKAARLAEKLKTPRQTLPRGFA